MRTVGVKLTADVSSYMSNLRRAGGATKDFAGEMDKAAKGGHLDKVADRAGLVGVALVGMAGFAIKSAAAFDKSMSAVAAATHAPAKDIDKLRQAALQAGKDTQYSATEAADGITELSKAGVSTADVLGGGLKGALSLAAAGQLSVGEAAETAASAMTQFKLKGDQVPHVADLLAAAAGKAQGSVHDMGYALNQSGLVASQFGLSIEDTTGALAEFANAGLVGSDAGTSFKTMLLAMANPSDVTAKRMQSLGISFYDAQGKFIGLGGVATELKDKLGSLTEEERNAALGQIFGNDAIRAATVLYKDGASGVEEWRKKVDDAGYASETAAKLTDNLAGDIERLKGSLETMAIESGGGANSGLRVATKGIGAMVDQFGKLPPAVGGTITVLGLLAGALLVSGAGWIKLKGSVSGTLAELSRSGPVGEKAAVGLEKTGKGAAKAGAVFAGLQIAGAGLSAAIGDLNPQIDALGVGMQKFASTGSATGEAARLLGGDMSKLDQAFYDVADTGRWSSFERFAGSALEGVVPGLDKLDLSLSNSKTRLAAVDQMLQQMVSNGNAAGAAAQFQGIVDRQKGMGISIAEVKNALPGYSAAMETAGKETGKTAEQVKDVASEADSAKAKFISLSRSIDDLFQQEMSADRAMIKLEQSTNDLSKELLHGARTLAVNSTEGRKNRSAVLDQLEAIEAVRDARVRGGMTLDEASKKYQKDIDGLRKSMHQAGFTQNAIDELTNAYKKLPDEVSPKVSAPGAKQAKVDLDKAYTAANHFAGPYAAKVTVTGQPQALSQLDNLLIRQQALSKGISISAAASAFRKNAYAEGGWTGPGGQYDEAGVVHADEYVIKKSSRQKIEAKAPGLLDDMNDTGEVPGYAGGGRVTSWPYKTTASKTKVPTLTEALAAVGGIAGGSFGHWPSSPGAQRGDSGVWRKIVALVRASGIPYDFGNGYRPGDPLWHGSGRAVDFMGYNQDRLANFFEARKGSVLELIHRSKSRDYGLTRGHYNAMPHQWPLHRNHLHVAMKAGGTINEPIHGVGASGRTYSFGENGIGERVGITPNWQAGPRSHDYPGGDTTIYITNEFAAGANLREAGRQQVEQIKAYLDGGGTLVLTNGRKVLP